MTAVHPPRPELLVGEDHLVAWIAGYTAALETHEPAAWRAGYLAALRAVAVNAAELDIIGGIADRRVRSEAAARIRARRDQHEQRARDLYETQGRTEYRGGPVPVWGGGEAA